MGRLRAALDRVLAKAGYLPQTNALYRYDPRRDRQGTANERGGGVPTFYQLQQWADECEPVRNAIRIRQAQILMSPLNFRVSGSDLSHPEPEAQLRLAREFAGTQGGLGGPGSSIHEFLEKVTEDLLVLGCCALYRRRDQAGRIISVEPVDASTIKPLVSEDGWPLQGSEVAYEQWIGGCKVGEYLADDLHYRRLSARTRSRWGRSPVEFCMRSVMMFMGYDDWNQCWVEDGDGDLGHWEAPANATPREREQFDALIRGSLETVDKRQRGGRLALPPGWKWVPRRTRQEAEFTSTQTFLIRRIAAAFQLNASVMGFAGEHYKASQEDQRKLAEDFGERVFKLLLKDLLDDILRFDVGVPGIECNWGDDETNLEKIAQVVSTAGTGVYTPNQARQLLGQPPLKGPLADVAFILTTAGPVQVGYDPEALPDGPPADAGQWATFQPSGPDAPDVTSPQDTSPAEFAG